METKLFDDSETFQRERPIGITHQQREKMYRDIATEIANQYSDSDVDDIIEDLQDVGIHQSGFEIAKSLERRNCIYGFSADFIEFLDSLWSREIEIAEATEKAWVKAVNPQPKFKQGDRLGRVERPLTNFPAGSVVYVNGIDDKRARYYVSTKRGARKNRSIPFEIVERAVIEKQ